MIPFSLNENWNVISRTILPIVSQDGVIPGEGSSSASAPPRRVSSSRRSSRRRRPDLGRRPGLPVPTATDGIATNQWGAGVTGVALKQTGPWTIGALANHIWSLTGNSSDGDINQTFLQPFVSYTTPKATSFTLNTESTYDWDAEQWSVPINLDGRPGDQDRRASASSSASARATGPTPRSRRPTAGAPARGDPALPEVSRQRRKQAASSTWPDQRNWSTGCTQSRR